MLSKIPSATYNASTHPPVHSHVPVLPEALTTRILDSTCPPLCVFDASPSPLACPCVPWCSLDMSSTWTNMPFNALLRIALLTCLILACTASCYMSLLYNPVLVAVRYLDRRKKLFSARVLVLCTCKRFTGISRLPAGPPIALTAILFARGNRVMRDCTCTCTLSFSYANHPLYHTRNRTQT